VYLCLWSVVCMCAFDNSSWYVGKTYMRMLSPNEPLPEQPLILNQWYMPACYSLEHSTIGLVPSQGQPAIPCVSCPAGWHLAGLRVNPRRRRYPGRSGPRYYPKVLPQHLLNNWRHNINYMNDEVGHQICNYCLNSMLYPDVSIKMKLDMTKRWRTASVDSQKQPRGLYTFIASS